MIDLSEAMELGLQVCPVDPKIVEAIERVHVLFGRFNAIGFVEEEQQQ